MGSRDYRHRETKKPKKTEKKVSGTPVLTSPAVVEVVRKGKKSREEIGEEAAEE